jgi:mono/diheme cytochrome c family protein
MVVRPVIFFFVAAFCVWAIGAPGKSPAGIGTARATIHEDAKDMYMHYCAACHGANGKGLGPSADALKTPPSDLTTLSKRHDGKFPYEYVTSVLQFGTRIVAHGSSDMPIWGPIFGSMENYNEAAVKERIRKLCEYLASIQEKEV